MRGFAGTTASTRRSLLARVTIGLLAAAVIVPSGTGTAVAITGPVDANAYALQGSVKIGALLTVPIATIAAVHSSGGLVTNGIPPLVNIPGAAAASAVTTSADGDVLADTSAASSTTANLNLAGLIGADAISSSCTTATAGAAPTATASVTGLNVLGLIGKGLTIGALPVGAAPPNTDIPITLGLATVGHLYLNTQVVNAPATPGAVRSVSVDALRLVVNVLGLLVVDVTVGHSDCSTTVTTAPTMTAMTPTQGPTSGGTTLTIDGTNFVGTTQVLVDGVSAPFTRVSATRLTATTPAHAAGTVNVKVVNPTGDSTTTQRSFTYVPVPVVTSLSPGTGPAAGTNTVTITGTNLTGASAVTFDGTPATNVVVVNSTTITATVPAGSGTDFVQVTTTGGTSAAGAASAYTYLSVPTLTSIVATSGPTTGGTTVTLTGTGFTAASEVRVDGVLQPVTYVNDTTLRITTPAHATGAVPVVVTTAGGTTSPQTFTYKAVPTVSGLNPTSGSILGGNSLVISGTGLSSVIDVAIDGTNAPITAQPSDGLSLTVTVPAHLATGPVNVVLTGPTPAITVNAGTYTYTLSLPPPPTAPVVTSLTPAHGPQSGGTVVTIGGSNFTGTTAVSFGGVPATSITVDSATSIRATAPAAASSGLVSVTVTNASGTSAISILGTYLYEPLSPGLTSLSPDHGPTAGGTEVTLTGSNFTPISTVSLDGVPLPTTYVDATHLKVTTAPHAAGDVDLTVQTLGALLQSGPLTYTFIPPTTVSGLTPGSGTTAGGTVVTVTGDNLNYADEVEVDGTGIVPTSQTATAITFSTPAHAAGLTNVLLTNTDGLSVSAGTFLYVAPAATVGSVTPDHGPLAGGNTITIAGTNLDTVTAVSIGGKTATITGSPTANSMTVTVPSSTAVGPTTLSVTGPGGTANSSYTYDVLPVVGGISPAQGPDTGGTAVTITGSGYTGATDVKFGAITVAASVLDDSTITATSPAGSAGPAVHVTVVAPGGTSATSSVDLFTYIDTMSVPTVTGLSPDLGSTTGGTAVTVTGTGFLGATAITFGGTATAAPTVLNDTTITAISPAHAAGTVDVQVTDANGTSLGAGAGNDFTYVAPASAPVVSGLSPARGPLAGGTVVTISGVGFTGATAVDFDGTPGIGITVVDDTTITVTSPGHAAGAAGVTVTRGGLTSALNGADTAFTYVAAPDVTAPLSPATGPDTGGTVVTITGTDFTGATAVTFDGTPGTALAIGSDTSLTVTTPAHAAGAVNVVVVGVGGSSAAAAFTYLPARPAVSGVSPGTGKAGDTVTISGTGFTGAYSIDIGGTTIAVPGPGVTVVNDTTITVTVPAHAPGTVDVRVINLGGTSTDTADDDFTYAPVPAVGGVSPSSGSTLGGTTVTVTGTGFTDATAVRFGLTPGTNVTVASDTQLTVTSPAHASGPVDVTIVGPGGTSSVVAADRFTFIAPPSIGQLDPATGPATGGTVVTITGLGFTGATAVQFDGVNGTAFVVDSDTAIRVTSPAHAAGPVDVVVLGPNGASSAAQFTYAAPPAPTIGNLSPAAGPESGGTTVTITGTGFTNATGVTFGGTPGTSVAISSDTSLSVTSPPHPGGGSVQVVVVRPDASSGGTPFLYNAAPTVSAVSPNTGPVDGGTSVTITGTGFTGATTVKFGAALATGVSVVNGTTITATSPPGSAGMIDVRVTNPNGTSAIVAGDRYTYTTLAPTVTGLSPSTGSPLGGTTVTVTGTGFTGATVVSFDGLPGTAISVSSGTSLTVVTPAHAGGQVDVTVTAPGGVSAPLVNGFEYLAAPAVSAVNPLTGSTDGGTPVTITGTDFTGATAVHFGNITGTSMVVVNSTTITVIAPAHVAGVVTVTVTGPGGPSTVTGSFTYAAPVPVVSGVLPATGSTLGGTTVTVTGSGFTGTTAVSFGGSPGTNITVSSPTSLTVDTPAHAAGAVAVTVTAPGGSDTLAGAYTFVQPPPTVTGVSPGAGATSGGSSVTITGSGFTGATAVTFGGVPATSFVVVNDSTITAVVPQHGAGDAVVSVTGPGGTSSGGPVFRYAAPGTAPVLGGVQPARGPVAGGTRVTLRGVGFTGATRVLFGGVEGRNLVVVDDGTIIVITPAGAAGGGDVDVVVEGPNGLSATGLPGTSFAYVPLTELPTVLGVNPEVGPVAGGTLLTIRGANFDEFTTVSFDGVPGTNVRLGPDLGGAFRRPGAAQPGRGFQAAYSNQLTVVSPPHPQGPVTLVVTNAAGSAAFDEIFTFIPLLKSSSVSVQVETGAKKKFTPTGPDYIELEITACSEPPGQGSTELAANHLSCTYSAPDEPGTQSFVISLTDVIGQTATQTVNVTIVEGDGTGGGSGGGNQGDGGDDGDGTGSGTGGGNDTDGGDGSGSGSGTGSGSDSGGLAFTGLPYLLIPGLLGGLVLLLVGTGLLTGDRLRTARGQGAAASGAGAGLGLVAPDLGDRAPRDGDDEGELGDPDDGPFDDAA